MTFSDGSFPFYPQPRKPAGFDVSLVIVIVVFLVLAASFLLILPGIRGRARLYWLFRVTASLFVGAVIVAVHFTSDWESGRVTASTPYKSFSAAVVRADVGLHVGLAGINVTLLGKPMVQLNETINYNEQFSWWSGADYEHEFEEGLERGLPNPILYVAEKFTEHSPCGLSVLYRMAGHYASATLWVAFCAWLIANVLFSMPVPVYGGYMIIVTGAFMIFGLLSFATGRNVPMCAIQFGPTSLQLAYGPSFWLTLATGLLCFLIGAVVIVLHHACPHLLKAFFDLCEDEEDEDAPLGEAYVNPYFPHLQRAAAQPSFKLTITNS
ncbi:Dual oxidase maturation factor 2 [Varanus komodoensis]|uniref:dual oxidase maturation factor 2 n=1 Tax=Varanus komodoensis TaxID=61221 RepID=UPI001CF7C215|nr:dual oxidase maturation factor 2 [Varanus komodoensis]KAF7237796.1 Dual oxidase maturation factor 2 [Varanus komodoensis]